MNVVTSLSSTLTFSCTNDPLFFMFLSRIRCKNNATVSEIIRGQKKGQKSNCVCQIYLHINGEFRLRCKLEHMQHVEQQDKARRDTAKLQKVQGPTQTHNFVFTQYTWQKKIWTLYKYCEARVKHYLSIRKYIKINQEQTMKMPFGRECSCYKQTKLAFHKISVPLHSGAFHWEKNRSMNVFIFSERTGIPLKNCVAE